MSRRKGVHDYLPAVDQRLDKVELLHPVRAVFRSVALCRPPCCAVAHQLTARYATSRGGGWCYDELGCLFRANSSGLGQSAGGNGQGAHYKCQADDVDDNCVVGS